MVNIQQSSMPKGNPILLLIGSDWNVLFCIIKTGSMGAGLPGRQRLRKKGRLWETAERSSEQEAGCDSPVERQDGREVRISLDS